MALFPLASNSEWELTNANQDIRGWEARDRDNNRLGEVTQMLMNTETERVEVVRLDTGREFATADIHIGKDVVYCDVEGVGKLPTVPKVPDGYARITRRAVPLDPVFTGYDPDFRSHSVATFARSGWAHEFYLPGYRFGYTLASLAANADKTYEQVEARAREDFASRHGGTDYSDHREAIRYGYEHHRQQILRGGV
jgi:hypothetical protein